MTNKLDISPDQNSYQLTAGADSLSVDYGGGSARLRRNISGAPSSLHAQWTLSAAGYTYFMAFYRSSAAYGAIPFLVDLVMNTGAPVECRAHFVPGSVALTGKNGDAYVVAAQLEVEAVIPDLSADKALVESFFPR